MAPSDRARRAARRNSGSELGARIAAAIPAIAFALFIVIAGGWFFVGGLVLLGLFCLHELFGMFSFTNPSRLGGVIGYVGLLVAAHPGDRPRDA